MQIVRICAEYTKYEKVKRRFFAESRDRNQEKLSRWPRGHVEGGQGRRERDKAASRLLIGRFGVL